MTSDDHGSIPLILGSTMGTDQWDITLPDVTPLTLIMRKLIEAPGLPFPEKDDRDQIVRYHLMWQEGDRFLREAETLREAGVQPGNHLIITHAQPGSAITAEGRLINELAQCFSTSARSFSLLKRMGYPQNVVPAWNWDTTPIDFWESVSADILNGVLERGFERLALAALRVYGANPVFAGAIQELRRTRDPSWNVSASISINLEDVSTRQDFGQLLQKECHFAGVSVDDLAREANISASAAQRWLRGQALPSTASLRAILRTYAKVDEFDRWNKALDRIRGRKVQQRARATAAHEDDPEDLLLHIYIPSERLYAAEAGRLLSLFRDWITKTRGLRIRQTVSRTAAGEKFEFFAVDPGVRQSDIQGEFNSFGDFLTLCSVDPVAAASQLVPLGLARSAVTDIVSRFGSEVRRLQVDLAQEREKRVMAIRHDLEKQIVDSGVALQSVPSRQIQALIEHLVPGPTALESLTLLAAPEAPLPVSSVTFQINQQFVHAVKSQVTQNIQGTVHLGPDARQLLELITQFGGGEKIGLEASVHELEDADTTYANQNSAKRRLKQFVSQLAGITRDVAVEVLEKYLESKGL
jgi:transcriptional regulator with XRE-family HTH domain